MMIARLGAMYESLGDVEEEVATGAGAFVAEEVCSLVSSE